MKNRILNEPFINLDHTFKSGQCFRWGRYDTFGEFVFGEKDTDGFWEGIVYGIPLRLMNDEKYIYYESPVEEVYVPQLKQTMNIKDFIRFYLRMDAPLEKIYNEIAKDKYIKNAIKRYFGLTILRQEPYETLISYMISPQNSVEKIAQKLNEISITLGTTFTFEGKKFPLFPALDDFMEKSEIFMDKSLKLRFGKNQKENILRVVKSIADGELNLDILLGRPYQEVVGRLIQFKGIGRKIADCVTLFSLDKLEAVPIDVHVKRITEKLYSSLLREKPRGANNYEFIGNFWRRYFGRFAGFAQEFLYISSRDGILMIL